MHALSATMWNHFGHASLQKDFEKTYYNLPDFFYSLSSADKRHKPNNCSSQH